MSTSNQANLKVLIDKYATRFFASLITIICLSVFFLVHRLSLVIKMPLSLFQPLSWHHLSSHSFTVLLLNDIT